MGSIQCTLNISANYKFTKYHFEKTRNSSFIHAALGAIFCDRRRLFQEYLRTPPSSAHSFWWVSTREPIFFVKPTFGFYHRRCPRPMLMGMLFHIRIGLGRRYRVTRRILTSEFVMAFFVLSAVDLAGFHLGVYFLDRIYILRLCRKHYPSRHDGRSQRKTEVMTFNL